MLALFFLLTVFYDKFMKCEKAQTNILTVPTKISPMEVAILDMT